MGEKEIEEVNNWNKPFSNMNGNKSGDSAENMNTFLKWGQGDNHSLDVELVRLATFSNFPLSFPISAIPLAKYGFHYIGDGVTDQVRCHRCDLKLSKWPAGSEPDVLHRHFSPFCVFDKKPTTVNSNPPKSNIPKKTRVDDIPLANQGLIPDTNSNNNIPSSEQNTTPLPAENNISALVQPVITNSSSSAPLEPSTPSNVFTTPKEPVPVTNAIVESTNNEISTPLNNTEMAVSTIICLCGKKHKDEIISEELLTPEEKEEREKYKENLLFIEGTDNTYIGIDTHAAKYPAYGTINTRIKSFNDAKDVFTRISPLENFAKAGFFYAGYSDYVRCFFCSVGLRNFELGDDPCIEHVRWKPKCSYIRRIVHLEDMKRILYMHQRFNEINIRKRVTGNSGTDDDKCDNKTLLFGNLRTQINEDVLTDMKYTLTQINTAVAQLFFQKRTKINNEDVINMILDINKPTGGACSETENEEGDVYEEYKRLTASRTCMICHNEKATSAMLPCGHLCTCTPCGDICEKCPVCNKNISGTLKTYLT